MEWLDGRTLDERLASGPLGLRTRWRWRDARQKRSSFVHREHFVHRDLKPANLVLCDGLPAKTKLIDFGIARRESSPRPERARELCGRHVGVHVARASHGQRRARRARGRVRARLRAVRGDQRLARVSERSRAGGARQSLAARRPIWPIFCEGLPQALLTLLSKMLATDPSQRPKDGSALLSELLTRRAAGTPPSGVHVSAVSPASSMAQGTDSAMRSSRRSLRARRLARACLT